MPTDDTRPLVFDVEIDGSISRVSGGPLEEPAATGPLIEETGHRAALEAIAAPDELLDANPEAFGVHAARRMQEQARAALRGAGEGLDAETVRALREAILRELPSIDRSIDSRYVALAFDRAAMKVGARLRAARTPEGADHAD